MNHFPLSEEAKTIFVNARSVAREFKHGYISLEHLLYAIWQSESIARSYLPDFEPESIRSLIDNHYSFQEDHLPDDQPPLTLITIRVLRYAHYLASISGDEKIDSRHILLSILSFQNSTSLFLKTQGIIFYDIASKASLDTSSIAPMGIHPRKFKYNKIGSLLKITSDREKVVKMILEHADNLFTYQQFLDCITICRYGLSLINNHISLRELLAYSLIGNNDFHAAIKELQWLIEYSQDTTQYEISLSFCFISLQYFTQNEKILNKILKENPDHAIALNNFGFAFTQQGRYDEAVIYLEKAVAIDNNFAFAWNNIGLVKYFLGEKETGMDYINKGLELDKGNAYGYRNKGIVLMHQNETERALENFRLALKFDISGEYTVELAQLIQECTSN